MTGIVNIRHTYGTFGESLRCGNVIRGIDDIVIVYLATKLFSYIVDAYAEFIFTSQIIDTIFSIRTYFKVVYCDTGNKNCYA